MLFSDCSEQGPFLIAVHALLVAVHAFLIEVHALLIAVASLVAEHRF